MILFKNVRNKVTRWKRRFIFVRDTRMERMSHKLIAHIFEWLIPQTYMNYPELGPHDVDLKNRLLDHVKEVGLVDLENLVTSKQLDVFGFVDIANLSRNKCEEAGSRWHTRFDERPTAPSRRSSHQERGSNSMTRAQVDLRVEALPLEPQRRTREDSNAEDDMSLIRQRTSTKPQPIQPSASGSSNVPPLPLRDSGGMHNFIPPLDRQRAKSYVQQNGGRTAMLKLMDAFSYAVALFKYDKGARGQTCKLAENYKQLTFEKVSLDDEVNHLQSLEMANRAASAKSKADELANKNNELKEELEEAQAEKESGILATKEKALHAEERARKAEAEKGSIMNKLRDFRARVAEINQNVASRAQGAKWLLSSKTFQDAVAIVERRLTNMGKVGYLPLIQLFASNGSWTKKGWQCGHPLSRKRGDSLPSFDAWVVEMAIVEAEPSSTPPLSQAIPSLAWPAALTSLPSMHLIDD
ncbi:hypothetical protein SLEP1_g27744 [Rubroshorea leprosula]|uniref:Uncharacterized protein n=1 Tax=Rubroshorea leprosula TaxID=152421 RepID=A0AAV5JYG4_9ROSI|nr:hypothetical protein SLEP1_g27744 [Rubroshorea leprosula]